MAPFDKYLVTPDKPLDLTACDPRDTAYFDGGKKQCKEVTKELNDRLEELQELLYAEGKNKILVVLQAMDAGGKDSTIKHVFDGVNPQGVDVAKFGKPTAEELAHDYLWRVHPHMPAAGHMTIFNRSHYEDVLVVRVHNLVERERWEKRYDHIVNFEKMLADEGTTILKFFLLISKEEQKERFQDRLDEPDKHWKFRTGDLAERKLWKRYLEAYQVALERTSKPWAPWYAIPADRKWYRNYVISKIMIEAFERLEMSYPDPEPGLEKIVLD
jgi:PPK2 family polyphosphate:nucleotide phosphotransferase